LAGQVLVPNIICSNLGFLSEIAIAAKIFDLKQGILVCDFYTLQTKLNVHMIEQFRCLSQGYCKTSYKTSYDLFTRNVSTSVISMDLPAPVYSLEESFAGVMPKQFSLSC